MERASWKGMIVAYYREVRWGGGQQPTGYCVRASEGKSDRRDWQQTQRWRKRAGHRSTELRKIISMIPCPVNRAVSTTTEKLDWIQSGWTCTNLRSDYITDSMVKVVSTLLPCFYSSHSISWCHFSFVYYPAYSYCILFCVYIVQKWRTTHNNMYS